MPPAATPTEAQAPAFFALPRWHRVRKHPTLIMGALLLIAVAIIAAAAPWIATHDPQDIDPLARMLPPPAGPWFGTHAPGRAGLGPAGGGGRGGVVGGRVSLIVGVSVALLATGLGVVIGLASGFVRWADGFIMRVMDGLMAIP